MSKIIILLITKRNKVGKSREVQNNIKKDLSNINNNRKENNLGDNQAEENKDCKYMMTESNESKLKRTNL